MQHAHFILPRRQSVNCERAVRVCDGEKWMLQHVHVAARRGPQAEVDLLAVAESEGIVEQAGKAEAPFLSSLGE